MIPPTHRTTDPSTSKAAGQTAAEGLPAAADIVRGIMADGRARIDDEIHRAAVALGHGLTADRIRHGRKILSDAGVLKLTGHKRATSTGGGQSREWILTAAAPPTPVPAPIAPSSGGLFPQTGAYR